MYRPGGEGEFLPSLFTISNGGTFQRNLNTLVKPKVLKTLPLTPVF